VVFRCEKAERRGVAIVLVAAVAEVEHAVAAGSSANEGLVFFVFLFRGAKLDNAFTGHLTGARGTKEKKQGKRKKGRVFFSFLASGKNGGRFQRFGEAAIQCQEIAENAERWCQI
jgi:hypothetical protein